MITDKEIVEALHINIHAVRITPNYKASELDKKVSKLILERFRESCKECREIYEKQKVTQQINPNNSFLNKLGEFMKT